MAVLSIPSGGPHPLGWVRTRLKANDELGSFGSHEVADSSSLSKLFGVAPKAIVEGNGIAFDTDPINAWVLNTGGTRLASGQPVFGPGSVIFLPPTGAREVVGPPALNKPPGTPSGKKSDMTFWILGFSGLALVGAVLLVQSAKKKRKTSTPV